MLAVALAAAGCGRRGALEPPPSVPQTQTDARPAQTLTPAQARDARREQAIAAEARLAQRERERAEDPYGEDWPYPPREKVIDVDPQDSRPSGEPPKKRFFLDPLLN